MLKKLKAQIQGKFRSQKLVYKFDEIDATLYPLETNGLPLKQDDNISEKSFFILFSYKNGVPEEGLPINSFILDKYYNPPTTTLGFKQIFWKIFDRVYSIQMGHECINWLDINLTIKEAFLFVSQRNLSAKNDYLDCLIVYSLESIDYLKDEVQGKIQDIRRINNFSEQKLIELFNKSIIETQYKQLANIEYIDFPGYSLFTKKYPEGGVNIFPYFYTFYYYAWLLCQRLEREQIDVRLDLKQSNFSQSLRRIANHRIRLVNIHRYFLTLNRSNIQATKETADILRSYFSLQNRYERHIDINNSFEKHIANISRISEAEQSQTFKQIAAILTFLGVPLALFSALMSVSLDAAIVINPETLWKDHKLLTISIASFLIPSSIVFLGFLVELAFSTMNLFRKEE